MLGGDERQPAGGLTLNASTGAITGKPTGPQVGQINFTVTVTDSENPAKTRTPTSASPSARLR